MKKKVLYVITKSVWGGAQRYVFDLATNLPKDKFEVAVAAGKRGSLVQKLDQAGIKTIVLPALQESNALLAVLFSFINIRAFLQLARTFKEEHPNVIHLSSSKIGGIGAVAAFVYKTLYLKPHTLNPRVIFTVHGWPFNEDRPLWQRIIIFFFSWLSAVFQDKVILIDRADYRTAERFIPRKKLALIRHGIAPIDFLPRPEAQSFLSGKIGRELEPATQVTGTIAELTKNKGLTHLLDAVKQVKLQIPPRPPSAAGVPAEGLGTNYKFQTVIIGDGEELEKLQSQIRALKLESDVRLIGFIPDAAQYLKAFDIFVLPSLKEGLPYVLMEAMAAGLPAVASRVGGIPDLIEDQKSGLLVPPKDAGALANAIAELLAQPGQRQAVAERARKKIENEFGMNAMIENTVKVYTASRT